MPEIEKRVELNITDIVDVCYSTLIAKLKTDDISNGKVDVKVHSSWTVVKSLLLAAVSDEKNEQWVINALNHQSYRKFYAEEDYCKIYEEPTSKPVYKCRYTQARDTIVKCIAASMIAININELKNEVVPVFRVIVKQLTLVALLHQHGPKGTTQWEKIVSNANLNSN